MVFHPFFHPFTFLYFYFKNNPKLDEFFHPSMIFGGPYVPHMGLDFYDSCIIRFILANLTQCKPTGTFGDCDFGSPKINFPIFGIYFT
jgi:hypothetical protein